jgi:molybdenum cofactor cytidylyltransferase
VIAAIVLAAGASTRMGRQKLTLPMAGGRPLVRLAVEQVLAAGLDEVVVVVGGDADTVAAALATLPVRVIVNPRYAEGQSTSLWAGLDALRPGTDAAVVALGDQPLPDPDVIRRLVAAFRTTGRPIAATGDQGGRGVITRDPARVAEVPVDMAMPADIDTPEDYEAARGAGEPVE